MSVSRPRSFRALTLGFLAGCLVSAANGQPTHGLYHGSDPPGRIGHRQLTRGEPFVGPIQLVEVQTPPDTRVAVADHGGFVDPPTSRPRFGLLVGSVYRFRVDDIPGYAGSELFPSIELIDGTSPPPGREHAFPLVIEFTEEDLRAALRGAFIVRVVAVEDPSRPWSGDVKHLTMDVAAGEDPLRTADVMGRPVAIVRMGSIFPTSDPPDATFCFGFPPVQLVASDGDLPCAGTAASGARGGCDCSVCRWQVRGDEWVCDGGDAGASAQVSRTDTRGLDATDTVAVFRGVDGTRHRVASNRVCLYSPKFFATRQVWPVTQHELVQQVGGIHRDVTLVAESVPTRSQLLRERQLPHSQEMARLRHAVTARAPGLLLDNVGHPEEVADRNVPWQHQLALMDETAIQTDRPQVDTHGQPAITWSRAAAAEVVLDDQVAWEQRSLRAANEAVLYESPHGARLQLIKRVSPKDASAGDVVHFTIRFDNVGAEPLTEVVIADHLSPRLEFVADSARCSCAAELDTSPRDDATLVARWRLTETIPPQTGGTIEFDCRVR